MTKSKPKCHLTTPERRRALPQRYRNTYWWRFARGRCLGYRRGIRSSSWFARVRLLKGRYRRRYLGEADDDAAPDDILVLSFVQALEKAEKWCETVDDAIPRYMDYEIPIYPQLPPAPPYLVAHVMIDYMEWVRKNRRTFQKIYYTNRAFILPHLGHFQLDGLDTKTVREWFDGIADCPARMRNRRGNETVHREMRYDSETIRKRRNSANHVLAVLKAGLNRAYQHGIIDTDLAWSRVKFFRRVDRPPIRYLGKTQCRDLVEACPSDLRNLVQGALMTGCRLGELRRMRVQDFLPELGRVLVNDTKRDMLRHASLSPEGLDFFSKLTKGRKPYELMFRRKDGSGWRPHVHYKKFKAACIAADIRPPIRFHVLRHTYASHAAMAGIPLTVIAKQLGHRDTVMVERHYSHLGSSYVDEMIQQKMPVLVSD